MVNPDIIATLAAYLPYYDYRRLWRVIGNIDIVYNPPEYMIVIIQDEYNMRVYLVRDMAIIAHSYIYVIKCKIPIVTYTKIADERRMEIYGIADNTEYYAIYGDMDVGYLSMFRIDIVYLKNMNGEFKFIKYKNNILI